MRNSTYLQELKSAKRSSYAIGAFNVFNYIMARAVTHAASEIGCSVILATPMTIVREYGPSELGAMLRQLAWSVPINVLIHLDKCTDIDLVKACVDSGWDSVMFDGTGMPLEANIRCLREVVSYAHLRGVYVEGALGVIEGTTENREISRADTTEISLDEAIYFIKETRIDSFSPAIGTIYGHGNREEEINVDLVAGLKGAVDTPITINGGTGLSEEMIRTLVKSGGSKFNVATAIRDAYFEGFAEFPGQNPGNHNPVAADTYVCKKIKEVTRGYMSAFLKEKTRPS